MDESKDQSQKQRARTKHRRKTAPVESAQGEQEPQKRKRDEVEGTPSQTPPGSPAEIAPEVVVLDAPTPNQSPQRTQGTRSRVFVCVNHPTKLGAQYACTVVLARNEHDAATLLSEWLVQRGLGVYEDPAQYELLEFNVAVQSVVIACSIPEHTRLVPADEWGAQYASQRRVFLFQDVYVGCRGPAANVDVAAGAIVGAMDRHDACAILSNMMSEERLLAKNHMVNPADFIELPRAGVPGGCVFPLSLYTTAE